MKLRTIFNLVAGFGILFSCRKEPKQLQGTVTACFTTVKDTFYTGDTVLFIGCSQNADSLLYNFGDGTTSALRSPSHIFSQPGTYSVTLRAANQSQSNTTSTTIIVKASIPANLPWRYFAPGSNTDSMAFYGKGGSTFIIQGYELFGGTLPVNGSFTQGNLFTFGYPYTYFPYDNNVEIYGYGTFSNHDSTVNLSYNISFPIYSYSIGADTSINNSGTFYGVRQW
jgi:hypothetical protein